MSAPDGSQPSRDAARPSPTTRLLLVTAYRWLHTTRLALAAHEAGFAVALHAPAGHPAGLLDWVETRGTYSALRPRRSVGRALDRDDVDLVVPVDDLAAAAIVGAYLDGRLSDRAAAIVERSLGDPASYALRGDRVAVARATAEHGVEGPLTVPVGSAADLGPALERTALPAVLKSDRSAGGQGVVVVHDLAEARSAYDRLSRPTTLRRCVGGLLRDDDPNHVLPFVLHRRAAVSAQAFVPGEPSTVSAACWRGELLGAVALRVVRTSWPLGPSTVVEPDLHPDLFVATKRVVHALGLSGLVGLDFMVGPDGAAAFVELNPRATPTAHLRTATPAPLLDLLAVERGVAPAPRAPQPPLENPIALFPQERSQFPDSRYLDTSHEDLPDGAPDVLGLCLRLAVTPIPSVAGRVRRYVRARLGVSRPRRTAQLHPGPPEPSPEAPV